MNPDDGFPLTERQSDHWPQGTHCKCGWQATGEEQLADHIHEEQFQEIDRSWSQY